MPQINPIVTLEQKCTGLIARNIVFTLTRIDTYVYHALNSQDTVQQAIAVAYSQRQLQTIRDEYLTAIPAKLRENVLKCLLVEYRDLLINGNPIEMNWVLQDGALGRFHENQERVGFGLNAVVPAKLKSVINLLTTQDTTHLDFTPLSKIVLVTNCMFDDFKRVLVDNIPKMENLRVLNLSTHNIHRLLPQCDDKHLELLSYHCPELITLDISYNKDVTVDGLSALMPCKELSRKGCVKLQRLLLFDTLIFDKDVAKIIPEFPDLTYLGYKETGKVLRLIHRGLIEEKKEENPKVFKLTHVDNLGSKNRRLITTSLRCKKSMATAISTLCPGVQNLKLRVADVDVKNLSVLENLKTVELVYHAGSLYDAGTGTTQFLQVRGCNLTSVALICNIMHFSMIVTVAECCPVLKQLWLRSNHVGAPAEIPPNVDVEHSYLTQLRVLSLRVGTGELFVTQLPEYLLPYLLRNSPQLEELLVAARSPIFTDKYVSELLTSCQLFNLTKLLILVPGVNSLSDIISLTASTVDFVITKCPYIKKLGNILSWSVTRDEAAEIVRSASELNWNLEIINKKMIFR